MMHASDPARVGPGRGLRALVIGAVLAGAAWRLGLMSVYAGWEESDYGNLAMIRGVLDGRFLHYDMNHLPGYYALGALVLAVVGDAVVAARLVSLVGGLVTLGLAVWIAGHLGGRRAAGIAAVALVLQPEFALYSATSLREPVYAAFALGAVVALMRERLALAGALAGAAFLVRFDGAVVLGPLLVLAAGGARPRLRRLIRALTPLGLAVIAWSAYCRYEFGTALFWQHTVQVNLDTGLGQEAPGRLEWAVAGARVSGSLLLELLPSRVGYALCALAAWALATAPWARHGPRRTFAAAGLVFPGFWLAVAFTAQHDPSHNLYWKWMFPVVPVVVVNGAVGASELWERARQRSWARPAAAALGAALLWGLVAGLVETRRQIGLSDALYRPQLDLARWVEANVPESVPMVFDNIPACWLNRRQNGRAMTSWFDVPTAPGDARAFASWLRAERVGWVLWFREDWTQAPVVAPFLADGGIWEHEGLRLVERRREDQYGWILFEVAAGPGP